MITSYFQDQVNLLLYPLFYLTQVEQIEYFSQELDNTNAELVRILEKCKNHTIDKILEKDDSELALKFLTGK